MILYAERSKMILIYKTVQKSVHHQTGIKCDYNKLYNRVNMLLQYCDRQSNEIAY